MVSEGRLFILLASCMATAVLSCNSGKEQKYAATENATNLIFPKGKKTTNDNFTGTVYLHSLIEGDSINPNSVGNVTFEPGARSKWHFIRLDRFCWQQMVLVITRRKVNQRSFSGREMLSNARPMCRIGTEQALILLLCR